MLKLTSTLLVLLAATMIFAQRPRITSSQDSSDPATKLPVPPAAPSKVEAKYEGGVFGYNKKIEGTLNFDDGNSRLVFRDKNGKETGIFLPYQSISSAFADTHSVQPAAATVASHVP